MGTIPAPQRDRRRRIRQTRHVSKRTVFIIAGVSSQGWATPLEIWRLACFSARGATRPIGATVAAKLAVPALARTALQLCLVRHSAVLVGAGPAAQAQGSSTA